MAWTCHGSSNAAMVDALAEAGIVRTQPVMDAMLAVDRALFVPSKHAAYMDAPQPIGNGATISAPHMHGCAAQRCWRSPMSCKGALTVMARAACPQLLP